MSQTGTLAFIGAGNMAQAIIKGLINQGYTPSNITATDPDQDKLQQLQADIGIQVTCDNHQACAQADTIVIAVKPQVMPEVMKDLSAAIDGSRHLIISIAAGIMASSMENWLGKDCAIVRCMPNTPALVGKGASALYATSHASDEQKQVAEQVLQAVGISIWVDNESLIDTVTAVSGSGPAYYFLMMEAMISAAQGLGLTAEQAKALVLQTAAGAAEMAQTGDKSPADLRIAVTSPKGTTEAALNSFYADGYGDTVAKAMQAAFDRSEELAELFK